MLSGESRYKWKVGLFNLGSHQKHGIVPGGILPSEDGKRVSLTFRCVEYTREIVLPKKKK
jgi:hypothetical protein